MPLDQVRARLDELALYCASGGSSAQFSGAKLWAQMIEGTGGGGAAGARIPNFLPYHAARVAATARAVADGLDAGLQVTVWVCWFTGLHTRELQAYALKIQPAALRQRLARIDAVLAEWFTDEARAARAVRRADVEQQQRLAAEQVASAAFAKRLAAARDRWRRSEAAAEARAIRDAAQGRRLARGGA